MNKECTRLSLIGNLLCVLRTDSRQTSSIHCVINKPHFDHFLPVSEKLVGKHWVLSPCSHTSYLQSYTWPSVSPTLKFYMCNLAHNSTYISWFLQNSWFEFLDGSLRCFVARQLLLQIYALSSVKFPHLKLWLCKRNDKYEVCMLVEV